MDSVELINYDVHQVPFVHSVSLRQVYSTDGKVEMLRVEFRDVRRLGVDGARGAAAAAGEGQVDTWHAASRYGSVRMSDVPSGEMTVITHGHAPYHVVWASPAWLELCGFTAGELLGKTLQCIQVRKCHTILSSPI